MEHSRLSEVLPDELPSEIRTIWVESHLQWCGDLPKASSDVACFAYHEAGCEWLTVLPYNHSGQVIVVVEGWRRTLVPSPLHLSGEYARCEYGSGRYEAA